MFFVGEYEHALDGKQRFAIPAEIRDLLKPEVHGDAFIAAPGANGCLWLWPEKTFQELAAALGGSLLGDEDIQQLERLIFSQAARVAVDSAGRVRVPDRLLQTFGLSGSVMILGVKDHLELMDPKTWKEEHSRLLPKQGDLWRRARQARADQKA
jgi:MraZ protein